MPELLGVRAEEEKNGEKRNRSMCIRLSPSQTMCMACNRSMNTK